MTVMVINFSFLFVAQHFVCFGRFFEPFFRFFVEFVRNNQVFWLGLTGQQFACLAILAALLLYYANKLRPVRLLRPSF